MVKSNPELRQLIRQLIPQAHQNARGFIHRSDILTELAKHITAKQREDMRNYANGFVHGFLTGRGFDPKVCMEILDEEFGTDA